MQRRGIDVGCDTFLHGVIHWLSRCACMEQCLADLLCATQAAAMMRPGAVAGDDGLALVVILPSFPKVRKELWQLVTVTSVGVTHGPAATD